MSNDFLTLPAILIAVLAATTFVIVLFSAELINLCYFKLFRKGRPYKHLFDSSDADGECPL